MTEAGNGAEAKNETGSENTTPAGDGLPFNGEDWRRRLAALNPWAADNVSKGG
ncbi:MAG: hypothetical protein AAFR90_11050 [Pseudomonadota bacterium]